MMEKSYEVREVTAVVTHGYKVSETKKQWGVFVEPYGINTYICDTKEQAEQWVKNKEVKQDGIRLSR